MRPERQISCTVSRMTLSTTGLLRKLSCKRLATLYVYSGFDGGLIVANFEHDDDSNDDHSTINDSREYEPPKMIHVSLLSCFPHDEHDSSLFRHGNWSKMNAV
jgi:hypothetical protein